MFYLILFIFGCFIGSFLGVVIDRLPKNESIVKGRSHCDKCSHVLEWFDLIPLFSFLSLGGKCRYCQNPIGWQIVVIELITGISFALASLYLINQSSYTLRDLVSFVFNLYIISSLLIIFFIDLRNGIIPNKVLYPAAVITILYQVLYRLLFITQDLLTAIISGGFFFLLFFFTRGKGMGFGDVKLAFFMGLFLGFPKIIVALYVAFLTGALIASILILCRKKKFIGGTIPFGPFLVSGTIIALFWGNFLIHSFIAIPFLR